MKEKETKVVAMEKGNTEKESKLSYEDLENLARQLSEQNRQLYAKLQELSVQDMFKRLDYLFRVVENHKLFKEDFIEDCLSEIEIAMKIPTEDELEEVEEQT